jgi:hypothetical protein
VAMENHYCSALCVVASASWGSVRHRIANALYDRITSPLDSVATSNMIHTEGVVHPLFPPRTNRRPALPAGQVAGER